MKKTILNLEGVQVLSRQQMKNVDGGEKCQTLSVTEEVFVDANGTAIGAFTCEIRCRPSFLGIGFGSWTYETVPCDQGVIVG